MEFEVFEIVKPAGVRFGVRRCDGRVDVRCAASEYRDREDAEFHLRVLAAGLPAGYALSLRPANDRVVPRRPARWVVTEADGDPRRARIGWDHGREVSGGGDAAANLAAAALRHAEGAPERIRGHAPVRVLEEAGEVLRSVSARVRRQVADGE